MELDFKTVRALSSPTRVKILRETLESERTPTDLSKDIGKSKSTVSSHLEKLVESGLLEKDSEEGRRRVTYQPTNKAKAIVEGRERKVKFSIASSTLVSAVGLAFFGKKLVETSGFLALNSGSAKTEAQSLAAESGSDAGMMAMDSARKTAESASGSGIDMASPEILLVLGVGMIGFSAVSLVYGITIKHLGERLED